MLADLKVSQTKFSRS